ncbi:MAG: hypothetical protein COB98_02525 [Flavobacteriaceae bacterium]|nr:MAG: hypothetical protein COB98_02525 [Flavobacteriaceae bacterium]
MDVSKPRGLISPSQARVLNKEFIKTRSKEMNKIVKKLTNDKKEQDVYSTWFSIEELENFIAYTKEKATEKGKKLTGLNVFLGAYGTDIKHSKKSDLSTVFFAPTTEINKLEGMELSTESDTELDGLNSGTIGWPPKSY